MAEKSQHRQVPDEDNPRGKSLAGYPPDGEPLDVFAAPPAALRVPNPGAGASPVRPSARLAFVGDLMLGRGVDAAARTRPPEEFWGDVAPLLEAADSVVGNLECPITETGDRWRRCPKSFRFRASPNAINILKAGKIGAVCLANNHMLDCEVAGLMDTLAHLDRAGIARAGAGKNVRDAARPALFKAGGITVGMVGLTNTMPLFAARRDRAGTHFVRIRCDEGTLEPLRRLERDLRRGGADVTVLSAHWGPNLRPWPPNRYQRFARAVIDLGFDVFHGHSAHILQGVEFHNKGLILYDTGDCLDDYWVFPGIRTDRSAIFVVDFGPNGIDRLSIAPIILTPASVNRARGPEARAIIRKILGLSRSFAAADDSLTAVLRLSSDGLADGSTKRLAPRNTKERARHQTTKTGEVR